MSKITPHFEVRKSLNSFLSFWDSSAYESRTLLNGAESQRAIGSFRHFEVNRNFAKYSMRWWLTFFVRCIFAWCFIEFYCIFIIGMITIQVDLVVSIYSVCVEKSSSVATLYIPAAILVMYNFWYSLSVLLGLAWECVRFQIIGNAICFWNWGCISFSG